MATRSMKMLCRIGLVVALAALSLPATGRADSTIAFHAGYLRGTQVPGVSPVPALPTGSLLMLVAAGGNSGKSFTDSLSAGQYVAGGDTVLNAFSFNPNGGSSGTGQQTNTSTTVSTSFYSNISVGTYIELRWFPSVTYAAYMGGATPAGGTFFGAYNPKQVNSSQTLNPDGGNPWSLPSDSSTVLLYFLTTDDNGGSQPTAEGYANFQVVPEPSAAAMLGGGCLGLAAWLSRKRRARLG